MVLAKLYTDRVRAKGYEIGYAQGFLEGQQEIRDLWRDWKLSPQASGTGRPAVHRTGTLT